MTEPAMTQRDAAIQQITQGYLVLPISVGSDMSIERSISSLHCHVNYRSHQDGRICLSFFICPQQISFMAKLGAA
jgi:hypothetical protein